MARLLISNQVFEAHSDLLKSMKQATRMLIKRHYAFIFENVDHIEDQENRVRAKKEKVEGILFQGRFLLGPPDENVRYWSMVDPLYSSLLTL